MEIQDDENFLDEFSKIEYPVISTSIAEYIEKVITSAKATEKLKLNVYSNCIDENEKVIYSNAIKNYYTDKYIYDNRKLSENKKMAFIFGVIGILVLLLVIILEYLGKSVFWMRVFDIVAWVFIWETVDILVFKCNELRLNQLRCINLIDMKIEYINI